jgi:hypothetical protein
MRRAVIVAAAIIATIVVACVDAPTAPRKQLRAHADMYGDTTIFTPATDTAPRLANKLLACATDVEHRESRVIGPEGGKLEVQGTSLDLPAGAVDEPTEFEVILPVSPYMKTEIHATGYTSFNFLVPAKIVINFARCSKLPSQILQAVWISDSDQILQILKVGGSRAFKRIEFQTSHLSGYAVATAEPTDSTNGTGNQ